MNMKSFKRNCILNRNRNIGKKNSSAQIVIDIGRSLLYIYKSPIIQHITNS